MGYINMSLFRCAATAVLLTSMLAVPVLAQQRGGNAPTTQAPRATPQSGEMSDAMVRKVGAALRDVVTIRQSYEQRAKSAETQQQLDDLNDQARKEVLRAINDQGLSVQQYQQAIQTAQADPAFRQRLIAAAEQSGK